MAKATIDEVLEALKSLDYPAGKEDLVRHAERTGARPHVVAALRELPLAEYASRDEIVRSVRSDPAPDRSAGDRAEAAQDRTRSGLAEHSRARG